MDSLPTYREAVTLPYREAMTPPYIEGMTPPNVVMGPDKFCQSCGAGVSYGNNYCPICGQLLVQTTQPFPSTPLFQANKLPPIPAPMTPITTVEQESFEPESEPDKDHKYDMAYKEGNRLIYDFEKVACCPGEVVGLNPRVADALPWELKQALVTKEQWRGWMLSLMENQKRAPSVAGCLCMFCVPGFFVQSILCAMLCPISMDHCFKCLPCFYGDWYVGLRKWQAEVNEVLNQRNMHVKLMTYKPWQKAPKSMGNGARSAGKDHNYEMSMMVISLTEAETQKLKMESWDHGVHDTCTSGIGRLL